MQDRTRLILKRSAVISGILACAMTIFFVDANLAKFNQLADIRASDWLSILGEGFIALVTMFIAIFVISGLFALLFVAVGRYIYDRFYRTPVL